MRIKGYKSQGFEIVYVDESGFATDMPRTRGYSKRGERCWGICDWHAKGRINVIGAIVEFVFVTVCLFNSYIDSDIFYAWLTEDLLPKISSRSVIVMDNATFHKRRDMIDAIESRGHILEYLPPYSPDLNPIENKWSVAKAFRKKKKISVEETFLNYDKL